MKHWWQWKTFLLSWTTYPLRLFCFLFKKPVLRLGSMPVVAFCIDARNVPKEVPPALVDALGLVGEYAPEWACRMPILFRRVMLMDGNIASRFEIAGRCWIVNPFRRVNNFDECDTDAVLLGGFLVFDMCSAEIVLMRSDVSSPERCRFLATQAALQFFYACRSRFDGDDMDAIITVFSELEAGKGWDRE